MSSALITQKQLNTFYNTITLKTPFWSDWVFNYLYLFIFRLLFMRETIRSCFARSGFFWITFTSSLEHFKQCWDVIFCHHPDALRWFLLLSFGFVNMLLFIMFLWMNKRVTGVSGIIEEPSVSVNAASLRLCWLIRLLPLAWLRHTPQNFTYLQKFWCHFSDSWLSEMITVWCRT